VFKEIRKYFEINENEETICQNISKTLGFFLGCA
jgi:hypothetical protein